MNTMSKKLEKNLQRWIEYLEKKTWLQILMGCLVVLLTVGIIFGWDPLRVLNPLPPDQIVAAKGPVQIDEERLATLVTDLAENEAVYIRGGEGGSWYCAFADDTRGYIASEDQVADRAVLHPYQRICQQPDGRWMGCPQL